jgi:integrase
MGSCRVTMGYTWRALEIILMLSTAGRLGAILDLTWDRVDFTRDQIRLRRDDNVTRKGEQPSRSILGRVSLF